MTNKDIIVQIDRAMKYLDDEQRCAVSLMAKNNIKKADDTITYRENTGAILYELKLKLLAEVETNVMKCNINAPQIKSVKALQSIAAEQKTGHPSWHYAYYSEEDKQYLLLCNYFMLLSPIPDGLDLIGNPKEFKLINYKKYLDIPRDNHINLPNIAALELYIKQKKAARQKGSTEGISFIFDNNYIINAEWLYYGMCITHATTAAYIDNKSPCVLKGSGYTFVLMPAFRNGNITPTVLPKLTGVSKKLF